MCVWVCSCMCASTYSESQRSSSESILSGATHLVLGDRVSHCLASPSQLCCLARGAPRMGLVSASRARVTGQRYMVSFLHGFWGLNLGPRACTASTLQVELSPQRLTKFFWLFPKNMTTQDSHLKCRKWLGSSGLEKH